MMHTTITLIAGSDVNEMSDAVATVACTTLDKPNVADAYFDKMFRLVVLYIETMAGVIGCLLLCMWLISRRHMKSRVNALLWHVNISDLLVFSVACIPQLIWETYGRSWGLGLLACRSYKYIQSVVMMASNNMLVMLSVDRYNAIVRPLHEPFAVRQLTIAGWAAAALLSLPHPLVYHLNSNVTVGVFQNKTLCESIWRYRPRQERALYLSYITFVTFFIPLCLMCYCYCKIFITVANRANADRRNKKAKKNGSSGGYRIAKESVGTTGSGGGSEDVGCEVSIQLNCTPSSYLPRAKSKTLKMTVVIIIVFIACGLPYHLLEMIYSFGDHTHVGAVPAAIMGAMAVANSAANPYIVLMFNACFYKCMYLLTPSDCCRTSHAYWCRLYKQSQQRSNQQTVVQLATAVQSARSPMIGARRATPLPSISGDRDADAMCRMEINTQRQKDSTRRDSSCSRLDIGQKPVTLHHHHLGVDLDSRNELANSLVLISNNLPNNNERSEV